MEMSTFIVWNHPFNDLQVRIAAIDDGHVAIAGIHTVKEGNIPEGKENSFCYFKLFVVDLFWWWDAKKKASSTQTKSHCNIYSFLDQVSVSKLQ